MGSARRRAEGRARRRLRTRRSGSPRASPGSRRCTARRAIARPCSASPSRSAVHAIACSERHSASASSITPRRWQDSCASTSTAITVRPGGGPQASPVRPTHSSSFARRPSASASSSAHDVSRISSRRAACRPRGSGRCPRRCPSRSRGRSGPGSGPARRGRRSPTRSRQAPLVASRRSRQSSDHQVAPPPSAAAWPTASPRPASRGGRVHRTSSIGTGAPLDSGEPGRRTSVGRAPSL